MTIAIVKDTDQFLYITDRFGDENEAPSAVARITPADRKKAEELEPWMWGEMAVVVRNEETGEYGLFVEASEWYHDQTDGHPDPGHYDGLQIAGRTLVGDEVPTLDEAIALVMWEAEKLAEKYPDLAIEVRHGDNTWGGSVMLTTFIPESSPWIKKVEEVGRYMLDLMGAEHDIPAPALAASPSAG